MLKSRIALASSSPRRLELLKSLDLSVRPLHIHFDESIDPIWESHSIPRHLAHLKNINARAHHRPDEILLTADTIVLFNEEILHKPKDEADAKSTLQKLSNNWHEVITGVCLYGSEEVLFSEQTKVQISYLSPEAIDYYVKTYQPFDKAGSYGIQEWIGWSHIHKIEGSFSNVMGLPTSRVFHEIKTRFEKR